MSRSEVCHRLFGQIDHNLRVRVSLDRLKQFKLELTTYHHGQHKAVQQIVAMNVGKRIGDDHPHPIASYGPGSVLTARPRAPVLSADDNLVYTLARSLAILRPVHHEILHRLAVSIVAQVVHKSLAVEFWVARSESQIARRDNIVRIVVVYLYGNTSRLNYIKFLFSHNQFISFLGSVITPVTALAATVSGEAKIVRAPGP